MFATVTHKRDSILLVIVGVVMLHLYAHAGSALLIAKVPHDG